MGILSDQDRVLYSTASRLAWADDLDQLVCSVLGRLVQKDSAVLATGEYGRREGCDSVAPHVMVCAHPDHAATICDELRFAYPAFKFVPDGPGPYSRAMVLGSRRVWGTGPAPHAPRGREFAAEWAAFRIQQTAALRVPAPQRALEDFYTLRTICELAALDLPTSLDLPVELQDIYVARNMGLDALPDPLFGHQLADAAESHLAALVDGHDLDGLAAALHEAITGQ